MSRQRALAWTAGLCLALVALFASPYISLAVTAALAQETTAGEGEPTDLAVVALHCAEAPTAAALESLFATGAAPAACAPAVGVAVAVEENGNPVSGSPFATDTSGSFIIPVGLGAAVVVREDPDSLPEGYAPLAGETDGVPYANPVRLDPAVAGAAVLFVNVPAPVAALAQEAVALDTDEPAGAVDDTAQALDSTTAMVGCETAEVVARSAPAFNSAPGAHRAGSGSLAVEPSRSGRAVWGWSAPGRATGWRLDRDRARLWGWPGGNAMSVSNLTAAGSDDGKRSLALSGDVVRIGHGVLPWPGREWDRGRPTRGDDPWVWSSDRNHAHAWRMHGTGIWIWTGAVARSGDNTAVSGSSVRIGAGLWFWPHTQNRGDGWRWFDRDRDHEWLVPRNGPWGWPGRIRISTIAAARSGDNLAFVGSVVRLGHGVWLVPPGRTGSGLWVWNGAIARSSSGNLAVSGSSVRIGTGLWLLPPQHNGDHNWLGHDRDDRADRLDGEAHSTDDGLAAQSSPGKIEQSSSEDQSAPASDEGTADAAPTDAVQAPSDGSGQAPVEAAQPASDGGVAAPLDTAAAPEVDPVSVAPESFTPAVEPVSGNETVDPSYVAPEPVYVDPAAEPAVEPVYVEPVAEPSAEPGYVAPDPTFDEPDFGNGGNGDVGFADPVNVAPDPAVETVIADSGGFVPDVSFGDSGVNSGFVAPESGNGGPEFFAPDPVIVEPAGGSSGFGDGGNAMPDLGVGDSGNAGFGTAAADGTGSGNAEPIISDQPNVAPDVDVGRGEE